MAGIFAESLLADLVRQGTGAPPADPLTTALIGSGATLLLTRGRRPVGLALLAAGGFLLWREAAEARRAMAIRRVEPVRPASPAAAGAASTPRRATVRAG